MNNKNVVCIVKKIVEAKKKPNDLDKELELIKIQLMLNHYYNLEKITKEEHKNLQYFFKKLLTSKIKDVII